MKKNQFTLVEAKKLLIKNGLLIVNKQKKSFFNSNLKSFYLLSLTGLIFMGLFYALPFISEINENYKISSIEIKNNSKSNFEKVLVGEDIKKTSKVDTELDIKNLYDDIFQFDQAPNDTIRLSASTLEQLFKDTNYNLKDVRETKLVKPISITLLPQEIKKIENTKKRKELFIKIILPLIIDENNKIRLDRKKLFSILNKNNNTNSEKKWLDLKFKQYGVINKDIPTLKVRMDEVPVSLAIAQAAKETGWGSSRFALEGNALFGQWTWSGEGIKPAGADSDSTHKVMRFKILQASVKAYQRNLNTHSSYKDFRMARAEQRDEKKSLDSLTLANFLDKYAETGDDYVKTLKQIIEQNKLNDFDDARLLPSSIELQSLI